ncbi:MAG: hypothetical protein P1V20_11780 [Verrucomicrobiales bacterium]|nr:hypothetical protein [Verrucomicrobiales bacterium]
MKPYVTIAISALMSLSLHAADPVMSDDFSGEKLSSNWAAAKGAWTIEDGKLKGAELASDKHAAVLTWKAPHTNSKVSFSFQLAGADQFHLSFNHPKGHLYRVVVTSDDASIRTDKDKKDPASKPETLDRKKGDFGGGKTHTLTCETKGDTVTVSFDNGVTLSGTHPSLTKPKTGFRFIIKGESVLFDDFAIAALK